MPPNPQETADLITFNAETLSGNLHFLCSGSAKNKVKNPKKAVFILSIYWHVKTGFYMIEYNYTPLFISYLSIC